MFGYGNLLTMNLQRIQIDQQISIILGYQKNFLFNVNNTWSLGAGVS